MACLRGRGETSNLSIPLHGIPAVATQCLTPRPHGNYNIPQTEVSLNGFGRIRIDLVRVCRIWVVLCGFGWIQTDFHGFVRFGCFLDAFGLTLADFGSIRMDSDGVDRISAH